jgi:hypothetical protein
MFHARIHKEYIKYKNTKLIRISELKLKLRKIMIEKLIFIIMLKKNYIEKINKKATLSNYIKNLKNKKITIVNIIRNILDISRKTKKLVLKNDINYFTR